ncbi:hypothetical protein Trydic_g10267 [Trypoxylus dichotomus]
MGDLPKERLTPTRPFNSIGINFTGLLYNKDSAVHIELVGDLTTENFLNALKRFVARRGLCPNLYSDNSTNFVGAKNELRDIYSWIRATIKEREIKDFLLQIEINWMLRPRSPHFGGLWESNIKCIKGHLLNVVGNAHLTYEQLSTLLCQIESILSSRPLRQLLFDPNDFSVITPGHFLIGDSLMVLLEQNATADIPQNRLNLYERLQCIVRHF